MGIDSLKRTWGSNVTSGDGAIARASERRYSSARSDSKRSTSLPSGGGSAGLGSGAKPHLLGGAPRKFVLLNGNGAPEEIRTPNLLIRSQMLYPVELRARKPSLRGGVRRRGAPNEIAPAMQATSWADCRSSSAQPPGARGASCRGVENALHGVPLPRGPPCPARWPFAGARAGESTAADRAAIRDIIQPRSRPSAATMATPPSASPRPRSAACSARPISSWTWCARATSRCTARGTSTSARS